MITHEIQPPRIRVIDPDPLSLPGHVCALFRVAGLPVKAFYRVREVAALFGLSPRQIHYMIDDGRLSPVRFRETLHPHGGIRPTLIPITTLLALIPPAASAD